MEANVTLQVDAFTVECARLSPRQQFLFKSMIHDFDRHEARVTACLCLFQASLISIKNKTTGYSFTFQDNDAINAELARLIDAEKPLMAKLTALLYQALVLDKPFGFIDQDGAPLDGVRMLPVLAH